MHARPRRKAHTSRALPVAAVVLAVVTFFALLHPAWAELLAPSSIISGSQYGDTNVYENLGWDKNGTYPAWPSDGQYRRRILHVTPETGSSVLFVAYVNDDPSVCASQVCRLEFKQSVDNGLTWSNAIESAKQYLPIYVANGSGGDVDTQYSITLGANGKDVWVSYRPANDFVTRVRKIAWSGSTKMWQMGVDANVDHIPTVGGFTETSLAVFVQTVGATERVWALVSHWNGNARVVQVVYTNNFTDLVPIWTAWVDTTAPLTTSFLPPTETYSEYGPDDYPAMFIPIGSDRHPALIVSPYWKHGDTNGFNDCRSSPSNQSANGYNYTWSVGTKIFVLTNPNDPNSWTAGQTLINRQPYHWENLTTPQKPEDCRPDPSAPDEGSFTFDFSVTALPTNVSESRVVVAYVGGYSNGQTYAQNLARQNQLYAKYCTINSTGSVSCGGGGEQLVSTRQLQGPSVGYVGTTAYIAARDVNCFFNHDLIVFSESSLNPTYTWTQDSDLPSETGCAGTANPSNAAYVPSLPPSWTSGFTSNAGLPPVAWEQAGSNRIAFAANTGGNVFGYGWSSNFGWLSLNCANIKSPTACTPAGGSSPYGVTISANTVDTPAELNFSPSPAGKTNPANNYAWSSNAGFLSFRRSDSVCDTSAGCTGGEDNDYGNPPGQAYRNSALTTDPTLKYDKNTQKLNGWGRFLNLCDYQNIGGGVYRCKDADGGWVRFQGNWTSKAVSGTLVADRPANSGSQEIVLNSVANFPDPNGSYNAIGIIGEEYFYYNDVETVGPQKLVFPSSGFPSSLDVISFYPAGTPVYAASGNHPVSGDVLGGTYGVSAYFSGSGYLFSGWAWSTEYGWVRFNPLIFLGYAWLETLFGNIYINGGGADAGNFQLPDATRLSGERLNTCGRDLVGNDGIGDEPCYVSTYRIEANGVIQPLNHTSGQTVGAGTSASIDFLETLTGACGFGAAPSADCSRLLGFTTPPTSLFQRDTTSQSNSFGFPQVFTSTATYRNALGKLDIGGLTTSSTYDRSYPDVTNSNKDFVQSTNRFGQTIFRTSLNGSAPVDWTVSEIAGTFDAKPVTPPSSPPNWPLDAIENQVVEVQGDLTIGHDTTEANAAATTLTAPIARAGAPSYGTLTVGSTANFPTSGALILETSGEYEEYVSYTSKNATQFLGVQTISCKKSASCTYAHAAGTTVRWVWRLPYNAAAGKARNVTIVVDGDLKIHYNILTPTPVQDLDMTTTSPTSIKDSVTIAFVVRGNVSIAKDVNRITGAYIVIGRDSTQNPDVDASTPSASCTSAYSGCGGAFDTGSDADAPYCSGSDKKCNPLTIDGLLFARKFNFQRSGALDTIDQPAERVLFDQKLFLNPPPGLEDVTKALPNPTRVLP